MALIKTFKDATVNEIGYISISEAHIDGVHYYGVKMMDAGTHEVLAVYALNRSEAHGLITMLTALLATEVPPHVH